MCKIEGLVNNYDDLHSFEDKLVNFMTPKSAVHRSGNSALLHTLPYILFRAKVLSSLYDKNNVIDAAQGSVKITLSNGVSLTWNSENNITAEWCDTQHLLEYISDHANHPYRQSTSTHRHCLKRKHSNLNRFNLEQNDDITEPFEYRSK